MLDTTTTPSALHVAAPGLRERVRERQRLHRLDRVGARLARLDAVDDLLRRVHVRVEQGWTQDAWFVTVGAAGERHHVGVLRAAEGASSTRVCLVAAVAVEALPGSVGSPLAQRALGQLWSSLHGDPAAAAQWAVAPGVTAARARDLVHWNDARGRQPAEVLALVAASRAATGRVAGLLRQELARG